MAALIIVVLWVIFGISTAYIAKTKGKDGCSGLELDFCSAQLACL